MSHLERDRLIWCSQKLYSTIRRYPGSCRLEKQSAAFVARLEPFDGRKKHNHNTTQPLTSHGQHPLLFSECGRTSTKYVILARSHLRHTNTARKEKPPWATYFLYHPKGVPRSSPPAPHSYVSILNQKFPWPWPLGPGCRDRPPQDFASWASATLPAIGEQQ